MSIALTVEDGTGVAGANSYCPGTYVRQYALNGGLTFPGTGDDALIAYATQAVLYLETLEPRFKGRPVWAGQPLCWPRRHVWFRGAEVPFDVIPARVIDAQCQLMIEAAAGTVLLPTRLPNNQGGGFIISEKVDVLETHYSDKFGTGISTPIFKAVEALLLPYLNQSFQGGLQVERA
jgi:hypothetical protein